MLDTKVFGELLQKHGYTFASGVPCSFLKHLINYSINNLNYIGATNEGEAIAIAAGAHLGGTKSMVLMQNSGLANAISPLTSLNYSFRIPVLGFVSLRGEKGLQDEPQHELTGTITDAMLKISAAKYDYLSADINKAKGQLEKEDACIKNNRPLFFIVRRNTFSAEKLNETGEKNKRPGELVKSSNPKEDITRLQALETISKFKNDKTVLLVNTGKAGRELFEIEDSDHNFYMVGSMGCISSIGLGLSLVKNNIRIIAIDGDGGLLMRMGSLATNSYYGKDNLLHVLLDNNCHDSTGGQKTVSRHINFPNIAYACGYNKVVEINCLEELKHQIVNWQHHPVLTFLNVNVSKGSKENLGRPVVKPYQVKDRLMVFINKQML